MKENKKSKIYSRPRFCLPNIKNTTHNNKKIKRNKKISSLFFIIIVAILTFYCITNAINPIIHDLCIVEAKNIATKISNEEATIIMKKYTYEDIVTIVRDEDGNPAILQTNTQTINEIISDIPVNMIDKFKQKEFSNISIYVGSILGIKYLSAAGPKIKIKIANVGNVETKLESEFQTQGINQTLHRVYLTLTCQVTILTPYDTIKEKIENQVLLAESVIMGNVPSSYYNVTGGDIREDSMNLLN